MTKRMYGIIGAGGFGREVMPLVRAMLKDDLLTGGTELVFVVEGAPNQAQLNGVDVLSLSDFLSKPVERLFNVAIADSKVRARIAGFCEQAGARAFDVVANNALIMDANEIGEGLILSPFASITSNAKIGRFFQANIYSYVAHDCVVGDFVTFAPSVHCNGNVHIGDHAYIGTGAIIKPGIKGAPLRIGEGAVVGMGAVVVKDVPAYTTVIGNPARVHCKPESVTLS